MTTQPKALAPTNHDHQTEQRFVLQILIQAGLHPPTQLRLPGF
jgi:hypothetical protein